MTYCLALSLDAGLVLLADSRTNAGVDNISTYGKLFTWNTPPESQSPRSIGLMTAGNLAITQEIVSLLNEEILANGPAQDGGLLTILTARSMFRVAERVGALMLDVQNRRGPTLTAAGVAAGASLIVAGQIAGSAPTAFLIYQAGNFIEATADTPYLQIGEIKYGKPILDRVVQRQTSLADGVKAAALSMNATIRSNLGVGLPLDLAVLPTGAPTWSLRRIEADDTTYQQLSDAWRDHLRSGFDLMPEIPF